MEGRQKNLRPSELSTQKTLFLTCGFSNSDSQELQENKMKDKHYNEHHEQIMC